MPIEWLHIYLTREPSQLCVDVLRAFDFVHKSHRNKLKWIIVTALATALTSELAHAIASFLGFRW